MDKMYLRWLATTLVLSVAVSVSASDEPKPWVTKLSVASNTTLRMRWIHDYEGYDTVTQIDAMRGGKVVRTFRITGQPVLNRTKTLMALPNCWHGGCETTIQILDLAALADFPPILFDREWFFKVTWEDENRLRVLLGAMNEQDKTEIRCFAVRTAQPSNKPLEPTSCASGSAPIR